MSYRIVYGPMPKVDQIRKGSSLRLRLLTAGFILLFVLAIKTLYPEGVQVLQKILSPGETGVTEAAFSEMISNLRNGETMADAVMAFCRQVIDGSKIIH